MKKYWLTFNPDVFLWQKENSIMLYNAKTHRYFITNATPRLKRICIILECLDNLYTVDIEDLLFTDPVVGRWIDWIVETKSGYLTEQTEQSLKPVSFYPFLKIQDDIYRLQWEHKQNIAGRIISYLREVSFYLNPSVYGNSVYFKQIHYPLEDGGILTGNTVIDFIRKSKMNRNTKINMIGDIINYPYLNDLCRFFIDNKYFNVDVYILLSDYSGNIFQDLKLSNGTLNIICNNIRQIPTVKIPEGLNIRWIFTVCSQEEYEQVSKIIESNKIEKYKISPLYTGDNLDFFENNIYTTEEDFKEITYTKREIFAHQALNTNFFGKLTVMPNEKVYSNVNREALGTIHDSIYDLIYKEMNENRSWRMIRDEKPCSDCVYQFLCPSPSNYELVIGKCNLCKIQM
jgi:pseudo-rSAM protein